MAKLLFFAGSSRKDSCNRKLAKCAFDLAKKNGGAKITHLELKDFDMPIYNGDFEQESGLPENAKKLKKLFIEHDGFFISSPEYNSSISPLLKNSLDWVSRPQEDDAYPLVAFVGKVAAICSASPGGLGGMRGLVTLRMMLNNISTLVIPEQLAVSGAYNAFDDSGNLIDKKQKQNLENVVKRFIEVAESVK